MEATECGAACLGMILAYWGLWLPLEVLRQECGVNRNGSNALCVVKAAKRFGMDAKGYRYDVPKLREEAKAPVIIFWEFNHFVVFEGFKGDTAYINDPASGHRTIALEDFKKSYTGVTLVITPNVNFKKNGSKPSTIKPVMKKLGSEKSAVLFVILVGLFMLVPGLATPVIDQIFLDDVLSAKHLDWLPDVMLAMGIVCFLDLTLNFLRSFCLAKWQTKLTLLDSGNFFRHLFKLPMTFFLQRFTGEISLRVSLNERVADFITGDAATVSLDCLTALFYLALLVQYSPRLTAIGVSFSLLSIIIFWGARRWLIEMSMKIGKDEGMMAGAAVGGIQAMETLKANGNEDDFFSKWAGYNAKYIEGAQKISMTSTMLQIAPILFGGLNTAMIMLFGGLEMIDGIMTSGIFIAFRGLMGNFQAPINNIMNMTQSFQTNAMQMMRLNDVMRCEIDAVNYPGNEPEELGIDRLSGRVDLVDVTFGYAPLDPPLIENFNLTLHPGRWVALVGASGSGKSTSLRLISGLYHEWSGQILFDGNERKDIKKDILLNSIACVDQDIYLFSGTVRENLSLFDSSIPNDDIINGAKDAMIHDDIAVLEGGYNHKILEGGANFSGGQRQRLEIARALAINPSILILDEATSALDPITEELVIRNIRRRGCACLMSAHRLSAFRDCDEIIVLENGKIAQRGTHDEMIVTDGPYKRLIANQAETE
jgi:NHLM bacteriocin system ABC transporter peptidase/ATP-binding protein